MNRSMASVVIALFSVVSPIGTGTLGVRPAAGKSIQDFLNAPVWYVAYEVSYKASHEGTYMTWDGVDKSLEWPVSFTVSLDRSFSGSTILNVRSPGPGANTSTAIMSSDGSGAQLQALYLRMDELANWLAGGSAVNKDEPTMDDVNADIEASMGPARVEYTRVDKSDNINQNNTFTTRTTGRAEGRVASASMLLTLDIDGGTKQYMLCLPFVFNPRNSPPGSQETVTVKEVKGQSPEEERSTTDFDLQFPRDLALDDPKNYPQGHVVLKGDIDPASGRISGEQSVKAHFSEANGTTVSGTLTFRYTLTMTPPEKQPAKSK
jgi:hypothetical protein